MPTGATASRGRGRSERVRAEGDLAFTSNGNRVKGIEAMSQVLEVVNSGTALSCTDSEGNGLPVLFLNGAFGTQRDWRGVLDRLSGQYRTVTFDARGRGKSSASSEYSFAADLSDAAAVIAKTGIERPLLVGWSHGAALAVRYAALHPVGVAGLVLVDGAMPVPPPGEAERQRAHQLFRRMGPLMRVMALFGRGTRMSPDQAADMNIELRTLLCDLEADYGHLRCPVDFILGSKPHTGSTDEECRAMRAAVDPIVASCPNVSIFRTLPVSHSQILSKHPDTIVQAVADVVGKTAIGDVR